MVLVASVGGTRSDMLAGAMIYVGGCCCQQASMSD